MTVAQVSVIIPNLHSPVVGAVLAALRTQTVLPDEVIVVGQDRYGQVQSDQLVSFIETPQPLSASAAYNLGARVARGTILLFIDADCVAEPDLIAQHLAQIARGYRAVGGAYAPATPSFWAHCDHISSFMFYLPQAPAGARPYLLNGNLSIDAQLFAQLGGFDEGYPGAGGEDVEFGLRLQRAGVIQYFHPNAVVHHHSPRISMERAFHHLANYGAAHADTRLRHAELLHPSRGYTLAARMPGLLLALAPVIGLLKLLPLLVAHPFLWRYMWMTPGLALQQAAWCWGFGIVLCRQAAVNATLSSPIHADATR